MPRVVPGARGQRGMWLAGLMIIALPTLEGNSLLPPTPAPPTRPPTCCSLSIPTSLPALRLRGGKEEAAADEKWRVESGKDEEGDDLTIFYHPGTGTTVEVDHQYSDGGIVFAACPGDPVQCFTAANELEAADFKLGAMVQGEGGGTGGGERASALLAFNPAEADLGDWRCQYLGECESLKLVNTFFGSTLYILKTGDFVFLSNPLADKCLAGVRSKLVQLGRKAGDELVKHLIQSMARDAAQP